MVVFLQVVLILGIISLFGIILGYLFGKMGCKRDSDSRYIERKSICEDRYKDNIIANNEEAKKDELENSVKNRDEDDATNSNLLDSNSLLTKESDDSVNKADALANNLDSENRVSKVEVEEANSQNSEDDSSNKVLAKSTTKDENLLDSNAQKESNQEVIENSESLSNNNSDDTDSSSSEDDENRNLEESLNSNEEDKNSLEIKNSDSNSNNESLTEEKSLNDNEDIKNSDTKNSKAQREELKDNEENSKNDIVETETKEETNEEISDEFKPATLLEAKDGKADNLCKIKGIGKVIEGKLHNLGIYHFEQIAAWSEKEIEWVDKHLSFSGRIIREDWIGQAKLLAKGEETEFSKRVDKGEVESSKK